MGNRALRRHHLGRMKKKRLGQIRVHELDVGLGASELKRLVGKRVAAATVCSCFMCGNPRKYWKEKALGERRDVGVNG